MVITASELGNISEIYSNYYESVILRLPNKDQLKVRKLIEDGLIFEEDKRRLSLYAGQVEKEYGIDKYLLLQLSDSFIIRPENTSRGIVYEISHDTLVIPILKSKKQRKIDEKIRAEQLRRKKLIRKMAATFALTFSILLLISYFAWNAYKQELIAKASYYASVGVLQFENDPTVSFLLSEYSSKFNVSKPGMETVSLNYGSRIFHPMYDILEGHTKQIEPTDYSSVTNLIVTGSYDNTARIWTTNGECVAILKHKEAVTSVDISNNGRFVITASVDSTAKVWDSKGKCLVTVKDSLFNHLAIFSADCKYIVTAAYTNNDPVFIGYVSVYKFDTLTYQIEKIKTLKLHDGRINMIAAATDNKYFVTVADDGKGIILDYTGKIIKELRGHTDALYYVNISTDNAKILTAGSDYTARLWNIKGVNLKILEKHGGEVTAANFSPDGNYIVTASDDKTVIIWDKDGNYLKTLEPNLNGVNCIDISPDSKYIAIATAKGIAQIWDIAGNKVCDLKQHKDEIWKILFLGSSSKVLTTSYDATAKIWYINELEKSYTNKFINQIFDFDYSTLDIIVEKDDNTLALFNLKTGMCLDYKDTCNNTKALFSENRNQILSCSYNGKLILRNKDGKNTNVFKPSSELISAAFSPNKNCIATACLDGSIYQYNLDGNDIDDFREINYYWTTKFVAYSPSGKNIIACYTDKTAKIWALNNDSIPELTLIGHDKTVTCAAYSPNEQTIVTGSESGELIIWDNKGLLINKYKLHSSGIEEIRFSPDGNYFLSVSKEPYKAVLWSKTGELINIYNMGNYKDVSHLFRFNADSKSLIVLTLTKSRIYLRHFPFSTQEMISEIRNQIKHRQFTKDEKIELSIE